MALFLKDFFTNQKLRSGELTAVEALRSYQAKALAVDSRTNCVVGWVERALEQAQILDTLRLVDSQAGYKTTLFFIKSW